MALAEISPLTFCGYQERVHDFVERLVRSAERYEPGFWRNTLGRYSYRDEDFQKGEAIREEFNRRIRAAGSDEERQVVIFDILDWGGMNELKEIAVNNVLRSFGLLNQIDANLPIQLNGLEVNRLASVTKLYEMWAPDNWIIYDS